MLILFKIVCQNNVMSIISLLYCPGYKIKLYNSLNLFYYIFLTRRHIEIDIAVEIIVVSLLRLSLTRICLILWSFPVRNGGSLESDDLGGILQKLKLKPNWDCYPAELFLPFFPIVTLTPKLFKI